MENGVRVSFVDATDQKHKSIEAHMVIGADGVHATVRRLVGAPGNEQYSGYITRRGTVPESQVSHATATYFKDNLGISFTKGSYSVV
jgi:2-polyprenyl-6-methoxyphenol hydroxylase-like FAD-dependent oxidoreductase